MADLLLVDNDARIVELTAWFLERAGHSVKTALSYAEARELLQTARPDLLLADLELGQERGREELPKLAAAELLPPTLVVSGFLDAEMVAELERIPGVVGTLAKPVDLTALEAHVAQALATRPTGAGTDTTAAGDANAAATEPEPEIELVPQPQPQPQLQPQPRPLRSEADADGWVEILPDGPEQRS